MSDQRYILTIATGKKIFVDLASNLARSFLWWHVGSDVKFQLVTDQQQHVPADVASRVEVITISPGELGEGFSPKLYLDRLASEGQTLFIDSDCLIFGNLERIFERFKGSKVSVVGNYISEGEWFGDIRSICKKFNIPHLPKFNGGVYYLEKGDVADAVYRTARQFEAQYDEIGFVRLRNRPNDEVLMALAMQLNGQRPIIDDGTILSDPQACQGGYGIDIIKGARWLKNPAPPHPLHQKWYPFTEVSPLIVHFLGYYTAHYPYRKEAYRLRQALGQNLNRFTNFKSILLIEYPERLKAFLKGTFRSSYHKIFGIRKIRSSHRA
jgi:hypothetical protein